VGDIKTKYSGVCEKTKSARVIFTRKSVYSVWLVYTSGGVLMSISFTKVLLLGSLSPQPQGRRGIEG
jgi:hypothetical protein